MARPVTLVLSLLVCPFFLFAQKAPANHVPHKKYRGERWTLSHCAALKLTPCSWADPYGALFPVGFEYYFGEQFGIGLDLGIPMFYVLNNTIGEQHKTLNSDIRFRIEVRQYFRQRARCRLYYGAEIFYRHQDMELDHGDLHYVDGAVYTYDHVRGRKWTCGAGVFLGYARKLTEHLLLEGHIGLGLRTLQMRTDIDTRAMAPRMEGSFTTLVPPNEDRVGDRDLNLHLPFAIKIAYLF
ncbi:DUF3575 domain-containing protein [Taibaiella koreensis]|uniref:DUF3575 domain-containing protein n=1 Tax=Taibaiella koreensis TaxID=1268548 RepID=UPI000E59C503|nr:DUF3575 domain-containing protein [Taibaiella koreensis]